MTTTGLDVFDATIQESNIWLKSIMARLQTEDRHLAYLALRGTLHALRDRIGPENAVHFAAQLPMLIRGLYFEGWRMSGTPTKERSREKFLEHVRRSFPRTFELDPEEAARAVFDVVWAEIDSPEVEKIIGLLPAELRELWPRAGAEE